ncbi:hypothetical protein BH10PSE19_BH10PSE19_05720 [soil metagenome]
MSRYLDPKSDVVFKKIFGEHPHLLKSFLNSMLPLPAERSHTLRSFSPSLLQNFLQMFSKLICTNLADNTKLRHFLTFSIKK